MLSDVTMRLMAFLPEYMLICSIEVLVVTVTSYKYNINHHSYGQIDSLFQFKSTKTGHFMLSTTFSSFQSTDHGFFVLSTVPAKRIVPHYYFAFSEKSNTFAFLTRRSILHVPLSVLETGYRKSTPARMAESVDALVSNTSGAIRAGSIPAPGTGNPRRSYSARVVCFSDLKIGLIWSPLCITMTILNFQENSPFSGS